MSSTTAEDVRIFSKLIDENRWNFLHLAYILFPFGEKGTDLEDADLYDWQKEELVWISKKLANPATRFEAIRVIVSSGNGAAKTAFGAMVFLMLLYTQRLRARITANTQPQLNSVVWPEYDIWCRRARYFDVFFEKFGTSIKARDEKFGETWRLDAVTWSENSPASISGLHNKGGAVMYIFEEAPGIPAVIWNYTDGAFTETDTIKIFLAFGNSDDPNSKFEQNMVSPYWHARRIDTRTLPHIDPKQIDKWLSECSGNEDHDDFRVRVRGLPRKSAKDSIITIESVDLALERGEKFDRSQVAFLPGVLGCDPAWQGGDETTIWYRRGNYAKLLERYRLDKAAGQDHRYTYLRLCHWERILRTDAVHIDQGEGTGIISLANADGKAHWSLVSFAGSPNDAPEFKDSEYANIRAQMYYQSSKWLIDGGVLDSEQDEWIEDIRKQLTWTKGGRHAKNLKKIAEPKIDIKARVGQSPDIADGFVLLFAWPVMDKLTENMEIGIGNEYTQQNRMPDWPSPYDEVQDADFRDL